jgi:pyridinium-3,5-biscarboxylic acid mononucleotide sulfurtransferase
MIERDDASPDVDAARSRLRAVLARHGSLVIAFSGGVDSALLAFVAREVLGERMLAVLASSPSLSAFEEAGAIEFLRAHGIPFERIVTDELENDAYASNRPDRCYHCKKELFERLREIAALRGFAAVAYGENADDGGDYRPGAGAAEEMAVVAPLAEAGIGKQLIRDIARALGLPIWDKPSSPCLASRIPYFERVTREKLSQVERAERALKDRGFRVCRVRHRGDTASIEVPLEDHPRILSDAVWPALVEELRAAGFREVTLESSGFRSGRLNDALEKRTENGKRS